MKVTVTHRSTLRLGGIEPLLDLEESEIEGDEFIDTNESLVRAGHHLALISTRPVMPLERMASMLSQFVFVLKIKIKSAFTLLFYMRFLFSLS